MNAYIYWDFPIYHLIWGEDNFLLKSKSVTAIVILLILIHLCIRIVYTNNIDNYNNNNRFNA